jgi:hypothetical protein
VAGSYSEAAIIAFHASESSFKDKELVTIAYETTEQVNVIPDLTDSTWLNDFSNVVVV